MIAGTAVWCLLIGGVRLREVSVSGGSTGNGLSPGVSVVCLV